MYYRSITSFNSLQDKRCRHCQAVFLRTNDRRRHEEKCVESRTCRICHEVQPTKKELTKHKKSCKPLPKKRKSPAANDLSKRRKYIKCKTCNKVCEDGEKLYLHRMSQHGGQHNLQDFEHDLEEDEKLREVYNANRPHILANHRRTAGGSTYNFPTNDLEGGIKDLSDQLGAIFSDQKNTFKINLSLGMLLRHSETGRYRYFIPYTNEMLLDSPYTVSRRSNLRQLTLKLKKFDLRTYVDRQRPDSKWKPFMVTNIVYHVYPTGYPLGNGALPDYIKKKASIISLDKNSRGVMYKIVCVRFGL